MLGEQQMDSATLRLLKQIRWLLTGLLATCLSILILLLGGRDALGVFWLVVVGLLATGALFYSIHWMAEREKAIREEAKKKQ